MLGRTGIAGVSSIFKSLLGSVVKALDEVTVAVASLLEVDVERDEQGVSMIICGGFSSGIGEFFVDEMGL